MAISALWKIGKVENTQHGSKFYLIPVQPLAGLSQNNITFLMTIESNSDSYTFYITADLGYGLKSYLLLYTDNNDSDPGPDEEFEIRVMRKETDMSGFIEDVNNEAERLRCIQLVRELVISLGGLMDGLIYFGGYTGLVNHWFKAK